MVKANTQFTFEAYLSTTAALMRSVIAKAGLSGPDGDDVFQEASIELWRAWERYGRGVEIGHPKALAVRITRCQCLKAQKACANRPVMEDWPVEQLAGPDPRFARIDEEIGCRVKRVRRAMRGLSRRDRRRLIARYWLGESYDQIAEREGLRHRTRRSTSQRWVERVVEEVTIEHHRCYVS